MEILLIRERETKKYSMKSTKHEIVLVFVLCRRCLQRQRGRPRKNMTHFWLVSWLQAMLCVAMVTALGNPSQLGRLCPSTTQISRHALSGVLLNQISLIKF